MTDTAETKEALPVLRVISQNDERYVSWKSIRGLIHLIGGSKEAECELESWIDVETLEVTGQALAQLDEHLEANAPAVPTSGSFIAAVECCWASKIKVEYSHQRLPGVN